MIFVRSATSMPLRASTSAAWSTVDRDGDDTIDGGKGDDLMSGGLGNDVYYLDSLTDSPVENPGGGNDKIYLSAASGTYVLPTEVEWIQVTSTGAVNVTGHDTTGNTITGGSGANILTGGTQNDTLDGGLEHGDAGEAGFVQGDADVAFGETVKAGAQRLASGRTSIRWCWRRCGGRAAVLNWWKRSVSR